MQLHNVGRGLAPAAMNRYAHQTKSQKQEILNKAHNVRSEKEMHDLVASLTNSTLQ